MFKYLWRMDHLQCPSTCGQDVPVAECQCTCKTPDMSGGDPRQARNLSNKRKKAGMTTWLHFGSGWWFPSLRETSTLLFYENIYRFSSTACSTNTPCTAPYRRSCQYRLSVCLPSDRMQRGSKNDKETEISHGMFNMWTFSNWLFQRYRRIIHQIICCYRKLIWMAAALQQRTEHHKIVGLPLLIVVYIG